MPLVWGVGSTEGRLGSWPTSPMAASCSATGRSSCGGSPDPVRPSPKPRAALGVPSPAVACPGSRPIPTAWLVKRIGGSGGLHIHDCPKSPRPDSRRYFQRKVAGESISLLGIISSQSSAFAISRQWTSPIGKRPYRYGGAAGSLMIDEDLEARLIGIGLELSEELGLTGLVSFDFMVEDGMPSLLEVNPRPGASIDVFDDTSGTLFTTHVEACLGGDAAAHLATNWHPPIARGPPLSSMRTAEH